MKTNTSFALVAKRGRLQQKEEKKLSSLGGNEKIYVKLYTSTSDRLAKPSSICVTASVGSTRWFS